MYYRNVCKYVYQFPSNKCDDPQGARFCKLVLYNHDRSIWFCGIHWFKYFLIITKGSQLIYWYLKYEYYKCLLVVNLSEYQDYINICNKIYMYMQHMD